MATYTLDTYATIQELQEAGMDSRQAEVVVAAISRSDADLATKADLKAEIAGVRADMANEFKTLYRHLWLMAVGIVGAVLALGRYVF